MQSRANVLNMLQEIEQPTKRGNPGISGRLRATRDQRKKRGNALNMKRIKECASLGMTQAEIADRLHVSESWLAHEKARDRALDEALTDGFGDFKESLRRTQAKLALSGHPGMLIWLGKQFLGQSDKQEQKTETTVNVVLQNAMKELRDLDADTLLEMKALLEKKETPLVIDNQ